MALPTFKEDPLASAAVGHYHVVEKIGEGGMGVVYLARDEHLRRDVALKLLREELVSDKSRIERFKHEAQILASLNHPNIAAIYGIEQVNDSWALVMEAVSGMTLSERLAKGAIAGPEIASIAGQLARALKYAHDRGIIHRDLKPSNLKITPEGVVKVLDFGLAKAVTPPASDSSTADSPLSDSSTTGAVVGTAAYMSPEQARGQLVDQRTDIWAFGVVLFEMLTGKRAFGRSTTSDSIAAVLEHDPDWNAIPEKTPPSVVRVLKRCLAKDPDNRWHDIGDVALELADAFEDKASGDSGTLQDRRGRPPSRVQQALAIAIVLVAAIALGLLLSIKAKPAMAPIHLSIPLPAGTQLTSCPAISSDGRMVAFTARTQTGRSELYLRQLDWPEAKVMPGTENAYLPFFSPDAKWVAFFSRGRLVKAEIASGSTTILADAPDPWGGTWGSDGSIIFVPSFNSGLVRIPATGGPIETLTRPDGQAAGYAHVYPHFFEDGRKIIFTVWSPAGEYGGIALMSLKNQQWHLVVSNWGDAAFPLNHSIVAGALGAGLKLATIDPEHGGTIQPDRTVLSEHMAFLRENALSWFGVSQTGTLLYVPADFSKATLAWVDREGRMQTAVEEQQDYQTPAVAPDGNRLAVRIGGDLWVYDLRRSTRTRLTLSGYNAAPVWTPDGNDVVYGSNRGGDLDLYMQPVSGTGEAHRLLHKESIQIPCSITPGGTIGFIDIEGSTGRDIWTLSPDGNSSPLLAKSFNETLCRFSPDGHFIAYMSEESGLREVYVQPYPGPGDKVVISTDGGSFPVWSADGRELFYRHGDDMMAVEVSRKPRFAVSRARILFTGRDFGFRDQFDVSRDGKRFLMVHREPGCMPTQIDVIVNWLDQKDR